MRKLLILITTVILVMPAVLYAADDDYFPLDQGMTWVYDDDNVDTISSFKMIGMPEIKTAHLFIFKSYNHEERIFVRIRNKIYEWKDDHRRLVYDFDAKPGDSWQLQWEGLNSDKENPSQGNVVNERDKFNDINEGATMTLVENSAALDTPMGEFKNVYHFRLTRPGVMDAGYVDEWFAPGTGCVMREWDTIAGPKQHRLVKFSGYEPTPVRYRMDVKLDKEIYSQGENIEIEISVLNWSDEDIELKFPSAFQIDYTIDDLYRWSATRDFIQAETTVTIAARDVYKWNFTHTPEDYVIPQGKHIITASLIGTELRAMQGFLMTAERQTLPEGLELSVATGKETYAPGETIDFTLTVNNPTNSDITIDVYANNPVKYMIDREIPYVELLLSSTPVTEEVVVYAGQSVSYQGEHIATLFTPWPGGHVLYAGLYGYTDLAKTEFIVSKDLIFGTLAGVVVTPSQNDTVTNEAYEPLEGAELSLHAILPRNYESELSFMPATDVHTWSAVTDGEGSFVLDEVPIGSYYILNVHKDGYYPYSETIRFLGEKDIMRIVLKPKLEHPDRPLTINRWEVEGLIITFGTGSSVYQPDSQYKAFMSITNRRNDSVTFTFDSENYVIWSIIGSNGDLIWSSNENTGESSVESPITLEPGETREFYHEGTFDGKVPDHGGKYVIRGVLDFASCTIESLKPESVSGSVKVLVVPSTSQRIEAHTNSNELVLDVKTEVNASIDLTLKTRVIPPGGSDNDEGVSGEIRITEVRVNLHKTLNSYRFVKMVEIDADSTIRADMDSALVRIYYDESDFDGDFDPDKLRIAHWRDNPKWDPSDIDPANWDPSENPEWEILQTRIDATNKCVEAYTKNFSSFGLFEYDESVTAVEEDEQIPESFSLMQNNPNPFNPVTFIQFSMPQTGNVQISVYNIMGQEVARLVDGILPAGTHSVRFDGSTMASGVYFYRVHGKNFSGSKKMLLLK
ncbi:MAG: T9SS type A sorting domain-containing protein [Candidatus Latescibacteria bacterium]|nr:T9SS type A sorting domain-containing protein [Candidatus Latescibacterota bacterium]